MVVRQRFAGNSAFLDTRLATREAYKVVSVHDLSILWYVVCSVSISEELTCVAQLHVAIQLMSVLFHSDKCTVSLVHRHICVTKLL